VIRYYFPKQCSSTCIQ